MNDTVTHIAATLAPTARQHVLDMIDENKRLSAERDKWIEKAAKADAANLTLYAEGGKKDKAINAAHDHLMNLQPHIGQLRKEDRPFIDSHVDMAMKVLDSASTQRGAVDRSRDKLGKAYKELARSDSENDCSEGKNNDSTQQSDYERCEHGRVMGMCDECRNDASV